MTRISVALSLLCVLCSITSSLSFVFEDCGSQLAKFDEVTISSCDTSEEKCAFPRGVDIHVNAKFTPNTDISNVIAHAFGVLLDVPIPFPLEEPDVCKTPDSGITCPLKKDQPAEYKTTFNVEKKIPALSVEVMWEFRTENDAKIICVKFPAKIV
ncbi:PREDICTED: ecdysteroid-regulated 16 kDa protein-like [Vollenhovia emeryi]|uniref:ecdysteroid-regulated 16 kDa protein-like n=1 Tax=Vollenhovia emeryi TaxID=411798 RepID=UPI0005F42506|nr:PREDICTED: ecdysteroid-regulated 16 kDa protein-like [Vollenhovia emeryi]